MNIEETRDLPDNDSIGVPWTQTSKDIENSAEHIEDSLQETYFNADDDEVLHNESIPISTLNMSIT